MSPQQSWRYGDPGTFNISGGAPEASRRVLEVRSSLESLYVAALNSDQQLGLRATTQRLAEGTVSLWEASGAPQLC